MHVLQFVAENYKRLRIVDITPKGRVIQVTGRNDQGKTSVLDALWAALEGKRGIPDKPVRKGADKSRITFKLGDGKPGSKKIIGKRTINADRTTSIELFNEAGTKFSGPQGMLDEMIGDLAMDPLEFLRLDTKAQVQQLRIASKVDYDFDAATTASAEDFQARTIINRDIKKLEHDVAEYTIQNNLPAEKIDDTGIMAKISEAGQRNKEIEEQRTHKAQLGFAKYQAQQLVDSQTQSIERASADVDRLTRELAEKQAQLETLVQGRTMLQEKLDEAKRAHEAAPDPEYVDATALTKELQTAQTINREIDRRTRRNGLQAELDAKNKEANELTRRIERRDEDKAKAVGKAKLPVEGLQFDDNQVTMNGIPIGQLGEAEQIRVSTLIAMAANPKLRVLRIMHGEALDAGNLAVLAELAEQHDFQIWMARVDDTGKCGIVMEDGEIKADHSGESDAS